MRFCKINLVLLMFVLFIISGIGIVSAQGSETCYAVHGALESVGSFGNARTFDNVTFAIADVANGVKGEFKWKNAGGEFETPPSNNLSTLFLEKTAGYNSSFFMDVYTVRTIISGPIFVSIEVKDKSAKLSENGQFNWTLYEFDPSDGSIDYTFGSQIFNGTTADDPVDSNLTIANHTIAIGNRLYFKLEAILNNFSAFADAGNAAEIKAKVDEGPGTTTATDVTKDRCSNIHSTYKSLAVLVLTEEAVVAPNITALNYPPNNKYFNVNNSINFNFTVEDDGVYNNCSLFGNWTGSFVRNQTVNFTTINNGSITNFTAINISNGVYFWNVQCFDNSTVNQNGWYFENYTFTVDNINPLLTLNSPANDSISQNTSWILNISVEDNRDEITVKIYGGNETGFYRNNSLLYKRENVANGTEITYNWSAPVLNVTSDTVLLMHFDNETFDNFTNVFDETGKNNGTLFAHNLPRWNVSGKFGYAVNFLQGRSMISISDSDSLDLTGNFSISFWVLPTDLTKNQTFIVKGGDTTINYYIDYKTTNEIEFGFYDGGFRSIAVSANNVTANQWNLITAVWNASTNNSRVYINGVDKGNLDIDHDLLTNTQDLKIGTIPGYDQNFSGLIDEIVIYNKTLTSTEVSEMYTLKEGTWYWKVEVNDTASNMNISVQREFEIGTVWSLSPLSLGTIGVKLNDNVTIGNLTVNVTNKNVNISINVTDDYTDGSLKNLTVNITIPYGLNGTNITNGTDGFFANNSIVVFSVNITTPTSEGTTEIIINISANNTDTGIFSIPPSITVIATIVATSDNPFLITAFETVPSIVSQNNTGIELKISVVNKGQGVAQNVELNYSLPNGWVNTSGPLSKTIGTLSVNEQNNFSLTVDVNSTATSGVVTLFTNITGQNDSGFDLNSTYKSIARVNVSVNAVSSGAGPAASESTGSSSGGGGGPSAGGGGGGASEIVYSKVIEINRGQEDGFEIEVFNKFVNTTLKDLTLKLFGFPEQYISISPRIINRIAYNEKGIFEVILNAPIYKVYEEHTLRAIIEGTIVRSSGESVYREIQNIKLIIHSIPSEVANASLGKAVIAVDEMKEKGFNIILVNKLLSEAESKLFGGRYKESQVLSESIIKIKEKANQAFDLIEKIKLIIKDPKMISLLTGDAINDLKNEDIEIGKGSFILRLLRSQILETSDVTQVLNLAIVAFNRGDYDTALERAQTSKLLLILEGKGNFSLFLYIYWYYILIAIFLVSISGITSYRTYQKVTITKKIEDINLEENKMGELIIESQRLYFGKKISQGIFKGRNEQYKNRLTKIKRRRLELRDKRRKILRPTKILEDLESETNDVENQIKKIQFDHS